MLLLNICSVNDAPADFPHIFLIYIYIFFSRFEKTDLEYLEQSLYLCILWF